MSEIKLTPEELEEMLDNAARRGAKEALRSIGLLDDDAAKDIIEMRSLIEAWRDTRSLNLVNNSKNDYGWSPNIYCRCSLDDNG